MSTIVKPLSVHQDNKLHRITGSEALILSLLEENVDTIFGYPGGAIMPIYDALYYYRDKINHILVRHEQGAAHAAEGYARVSGKVGVCFATSGPGATNLITGIADARIDSTPIVCITGQVPSHLLGTDAFQETDVLGISMPVTKWNFQVTRAEEIPDAVAKAFYIAKSGRPGPVLVDITKDAQFGKIDFKYNKCEKIRSYHPYPVVNQEAVSKAAELINASQKPLIVAGHGILISNAEKELLELSEKGDIPVGLTLLGLSCFPPDHKNYIGYLGMHGNYGPNIKTNECDLLIAIGMRFDDRVTGDVNKYARQAKVIHIEIDPSEINKNIKADVAINADARQTLEVLNKLINPNHHQKWIDEFHECDKIEYEKVIDKQIHPDGEKLLMAQVIHRLGEKTKGEAVIVSDVGQHQMIVSRYYKFKLPNHHISSGGLGTMGFSLPAAMGAILGIKNTPVIAVVGDGGFQMTIQELGTIHHFKIPLKIILLNNQFLGMVRQWQQLFFDSRYSFTELTNPDFIKIAEGYGFNTKKISAKSELENALDWLLESSGPTFLEVNVEKEDNVFPMVPSGDSVSNIRLE